MLGIGYIKNGFMEINSPKDAILRDGDICNSSAMKLAENIAIIGNKLAAESKHVKSVGAFIRESRAGFDVTLKEPIRPCVLQYNEHAKKYLKLDLEQEGKTWKWLQSPEINVFAFMLFSGKNFEADRVPLSPFAYLKGSNGKYERTRHPNVSDSGSICMGGLSGCENLSELSISALVNMLTNMAIYSSYFRPTIVDIKTNVHFSVESNIIKAVVDKKLTTEPAKLLAQYTTLEEWL